MTDTVTEHGDHAVRIISAAQRQADAHVAEAKAMAAEIVRDARATRRDLVAMAQAEADKVLSQARDDAEQIRAEAIREAASIAARASAEAPAELRSEIARLQEQATALTAHADMIRAMARTFAESLLTSLDSWAGKAGVARHPDERKHSGVPRTQGKREGHRPGAGDGSGEPAGG